MCIEGFVSIISARIQAIQLKRTCCMCWNINSVRCDLWPGHRGKNCIINTRTMHKVITCLSQVLETDFTIVSLPLLVRQIQIILDGCTKVFSVFPNASAWQTLNSVALYSRIQTFFFVIGLFYSWYTRLEQGRSYKRNVDLMDGWQGTNGSTISGKESKVFRFETHSEICSTRICNIGTHGIEQVLGIIRLWSQGKPHIYNT